jgi:hypothetical protein
VGERRVVRQGGGLRSRSMPAGSPLVHVRCPAGRWQHRRDPAGARFDFSAHYAMLGRANDAAKPTMPLIATRMHRAMYTFGTPWDSGDRRVLKSARGLAKQSDPSSLEPAASDHAHR